MKSFSLEGALSLDNHFLGGHAHGGHQHAHALMSSLGLESPKKVRREDLEEWLKTVVERLGRLEEMSQIHQRNVCFSFFFIGLLFGMLFLYVEAFYQLLTV